MEWGHSEDCWGVLSCVQPEGQTTRQHDLKALLGNSSQGWMSQQVLFHLADELGFHRDGEETNKAQSWDPGTHGPVGPSLASQQPGSLSTALTEPNVSSWQLIAWGLSTFGRRGERNR